MNNLKTNNNKIIDVFEQQGFVLIREFFKKSFIIKVKKSLKLFLKKNYISLKGVNFVDKKTNKINTVHNITQWKFLKKIQNDKKISFFAKNLLKKKVKNFGAEVFAKPARIGLESPPHQDNFYWNIKNNKGLTCWIALDESNKKNGSIYYYAKSHKLGLLDHSPSFAKGSSQKISNIKKLKKNKKIYPELKVGDILIHSCLIVHGSKKNLSNQNRMGLTLRFIPAGSKFNLKKKRKYEKSLKQQQKFLN